MRRQLSHVFITICLMSTVGILGCQQETPAGKTGAQNNQPASAVDQAAQQAIDSIRTPMDKARGVEGTLNKAAESTADKVKEAGP